MECPGVEFIERMCRGNLERFGIRSCRFHISLKFVSCSRRGNEALIDGFFEQG
jgi:hypothetical protein